MTGDIQKNCGCMRVGIDVGSTTVKIVVTDISTNKIEYSRYVRHNARQVETARLLLEEAAGHFGRDVSFKAAVCGSGGKPVSKALGIHYIQEVVANAAAVQRLYPDVRTAIELGGQDAKVIFFYYDKNTDKLQTSDMRMNGSCAGGTGAFIDEIASLLGISSDKFESMASKGSTVYDISGRCGVFAKTDIQPLLIQGADRNDIALSTFHAIAKQTIGGLSQGLELKPPIIFEGGPLTFNPTLIKVFAERLELKGDDIVVPEHAETIVAYGTAVAIDNIFADKAEYVTFGKLLDRLQSYNSEDYACDKRVSEPFFKTQEELDKFNERHDKELYDVCKDYKTEVKDGVLNVYLGIDSGSTTSKFVLIDENEQVIDRFYANNHGDPLKVVKHGIVQIYDKYKSKGITLKCLGLGTTGYGEHLLAKALRADYHTVETVAHTIGCQKYYPDTTFILDIGGQDMKAIWLNDGVITNIMLNEACSSGCGSFLENFAVNLGIDVSDIADKAFASKNPAHLGSRCTVFMNSTIINEQRDGKQPQDIMAGLCRSIIENVFTKVVRIANTSELGNRVVVQGGTFRNRAVLRAIEEYLSMDVTLAPYPGEMGAVGAALAAKQHIKQYGYADNESTSFIGFEAVRTFEYTTESGVRCEHCGNHCMRNIMHFPDGGTWVTGNRCENGLLPDNAAAKCATDMADKEKDLKNAESEAKKQTAAAVEEEEAYTPVDVFAARERLLFKDYDYTRISDEKNVIVGIPRVLEFWDSMPFWTTFLKALGYNVKISQKSNRRMYENGLKYVASDTICFPAKLVHGHIENLVNQKVDRIFMPYVMHMPPEGTDKLSPYVCSVVMGYPMVVRNSQTPEERYGVKFDTPIFHWFSVKDRRHQIIKYATDELGVTKNEAEEAYKQAKAARDEFKDTLVSMADEVLEDAKKHKKFVVVLAGRPYHTDPFVSKNISHMLIKKGISVLPVDSLRQLNEQDLSNTRAEITNNFHTRMLSAAMVAAKTPELEYIQIVSFGCGHDAILSDEIIRIMNESGHKPPLVLKVDESDATGALGIRIQSFIRSVEIRRSISDEQFIKRHMYESLTEPSPAKFYRKDKKVRTILVPNISVEVSKILEGILEKENFKVKRIPIGSTEEIKLGKKYVHNDICFPAQMVIGELIAELKRGNYNHDEVAVGMVKFQCDCRMSHYAGLLRKGLDASGFSDVPILTTDVNDTKRNHPGVFLLGVSAVLEAVWTFMMLDMLTDVCRKTRPYEINKGETDRVYNHCVEMLADGIRKGIGNARKVFEQCMKDMAAVPYDRSTLKPKVFITGELLVTYHSGSNFNIERYMEANGMETIFPRITDQLRKDFLASMVEIKDYNANIFPYPFAVDWLFDHVQKSLEKIAVLHPLYKKALRPRDMYEGVRNIIPETLSCGEGWLMAAEIVHYAKEGVKSFIILQPFGCLPNHICGRGVIKRIKEDYPDVTILPLDLDPDTSYANVENRMQMMIMNS